MQLLIAFGLLIVAAAALMMLSIFTHRKLKKEFAHSISEAPPVVRSVVAKDSPADSAQQNELTNP